MVNPFTGVPAQPLAAPATTAPAGAHRWAGGSVPNPGTPFSGVNPYLGKTARPGSMLQVFGARPTANEQINRVTAAAVSRFQQIRASNPNMTPQAAMTELFNTAEGQAAINDPNFVQNVVPVLTAAMQVPVEKSTLVGPDQILMGDQTGGVVGRGARVGPDNRLIPEPVDPKVLGRDQVLVPGTGGKPIARGAGVDENGGLIQDPTNVDRYGVVYNPDGSIKFHGAGVKIGTDGKPQIIPEDQKLSAEAQSLVDLFAIMRDGDPEMARAAEQIIALKTQGDNVAKNRVIDGLVARGFLPFETGERWKAGLIDVYHQTDPFTGAPIGPPILTDMVTGQSVQFGQTLDDAFAVNGVRKLGDAVVGPTGVPEVPAQMPQSGAGQPQKPKASRITVSEAPAVLQPAFVKYGNQYGIPADILASVAAQESNFKPWKISQKGAKGLMGFTDATAKDYGVDVANNDSSIAGAAKYLSVLKEKYGGNMDYALAAYNWGPDNVDKWLNGEKRMPRETRDYIAQVQGRQASGQYDNYTELGFTAAADKGGAPAPDRIVADKLPSAAQYDDPSEMVLGAGPMQWAVENAGRFAANLDPSLQPENLVKWRTSLRTIKAKATELADTGSRLVGDSDALRALVPSLGILEDPKSAAQELLSVITHVQTLKEQALTIRNDQLENETVRKDASTFLQQLIRFEKTLPTKDQLLNRLRMFEEGGGGLEDQTVGAYLSHAQELFDKVLGIGGELVTDVTSGNAIDIIGMPEAEFLKLDPRDPKWTKTQRDQAKRRYNEITTRGTSPWFGRETK